MKKSSYFFLVAITLFWAASVKAQTITIIPGEQVPFTFIKQSELINLTADGDRCFISKYYENAENHFHLISSDSKNKIKFNGELEIKGGVFNNTFSIKKVISLGTKAYALVEHLDKAAGKNTFLARSFSAGGEVSAEEKELMSITFEKIMNSGNNYSAVSPDKNTMAVLGELPYAKEQPERFKVVLYDKDLNKTSEGEIQMPGEGKKGNDITAAVANNGTLYILKKLTTNKGEIDLRIYQWSASSAGEVKEYAFELTSPNQVYNYTYEVNSKNEIIVCGTFYERRTVMAGDTKATGIFYSTNKGLSEKVFKTFSLDAPVENLTVRKILVNGNTVFLTAEQYKKEEIPKQGGSMSFDFNYNFTHKDEYAIGMDEDGNKKFQILIAKDFTARNFDEQFYSGYFLCNGKLTVVYNDLTKKYMPDNSSYGYQIPVVVQITNDGLMQSPVVLKDALRIQEYFMLFPYWSVQDSDNQIGFITGNSENKKIVTMKLE